MAVALKYATCNYAVSIHFYEFLRREVERFGRTPDAQSIGAVLLPPSIDTNVDAAHKKCVRHDGAKVLSQNLSRNPVRVA
jgi:hypothetical protein